MRGCIGSVLRCAGASGAQWRAGAQFEGGQSRAAAMGSTALDLSGCGDNQRPAADVCRTRRQGRRGAGFVWALRSEPGERSRRIAIDDGDESVVGGRWWTSLLAGAPLAT